MNLSDTHNSYLTAFGVHEMHGQMHPNYSQISILLVVDLCSSLAYVMMTQPLSKASKLPIKTLVARRLPTNNHIILSVVFNVHVSVYSIIVGDLSSMLFECNIFLSLRFYRAPPPFWACLHRLHIP